MARWLVKEEPSHYSHDDLTRDGTTVWNGVHNALALRHLKAMRPGDELFYYHSGDVRSVVGLASVASAPEPDPEDDRGSWRVTVRAGRPLPRPVPLSTLKTDPSLADFALVRMGRLSVMPVTEDQWRRVLSYAGPIPAPSQSRAAGRRPKRRSASARKRGST